MIDPEKMNMEMMEKLEPFMMEIESQIRGF
jgi:hypothetical protein